MKCLFCKSTELSITSCGEYQYSVFCEICGAEGPAGINEKEAKHIFAKANNLIDYHKVIEFINVLRPAKMGGIIAITEGRILDKLHQQIRSLKRNG